MVPRRHPTRKPRPKRKLVHRGERLRAVRQERGLTVRQLADRVGVTHSCIVKLEQRSRTGKLETWEMVAEALDVSISNLFEEAAA